MAVWKALLIVYRELDVRLRHGRWRKRHFHHVATTEQVADATESFRAFPNLVSELTSGAAQIEENIVEINLPLRSLTEEVGRFFGHPPMNASGLGRVSACEFLQIDFYLLASE